MVELVGSALHLEVGNHAVGGSQSTATARLVSEEPPPPTDLALVMTGLNDVRLRGEDPRCMEEYAASLESVITAVLRSNPEAHIVVLEQPMLLDYSHHAPHNRGSDRLVTELNSALRRVTERHSAVTVVPVPADWDPRTMLSEDTVHPNDAGHACLANAVVSTLSAARWER